MAEVDKDVTKFRARAAALRAAAEESRDPVRRQEALALATHWDEVALQIESARERLRGE